MFCLALASFQELQKTGRNMQPYIIVLIFFAVCLSYGIYRAIQDYVIYNNFDKWLKS